jgi:hypothetical protein
MAQITIQDQLPVGKTVHQLTFEVGTTRLTARELIRLRVHEEVMMYNLSPAGVFKGLVQPTEPEETLNGTKLRQRRPIDWERQAQIALQAFEANGFFILVDDHQVEDLDEVIELQENIQIAFVKLIPLAGG